jgi:signal transduction histidine kinase
MNTLLSEGNEQIVDQIRVDHRMVRYHDFNPAEEMEPSNFTIGFEKDFHQLSSEVTSVIGGADPRSDPSQQRTLRVLYELSLNLSRVQSIEAIARKGLETLLQSTDAERAVLFLMESVEAPARPFLVLDRESGFEAGETITLSSTVANLVLRERKGIMTSDTCFDGRRGVLPAIRHSIAAPLLGKGEPPGLVYLEKNRTNGTFSQEDLKLVCAVSTQLGISIENALVLEELRGSREVLERLVEEQTRALRRTQLKLYQTEKIASLSRLVAGVAHEINSPLGALKSNLELLTVTFGRLATTQGRAKDETKLFEHLVTMTHASVLACARIVGVVHSLSSFARLDESEYKIVSINDCIRTVVQLLDPGLKKQAKIVLELDELPAIPCYAALLNESFMNLLVNACQAIRKEGEVTIRTCREESDVVVTMKDTGVGIKREHLDKIFEPGFTTKGVGVGIGIGLAVAYRVITEHRGTIDVESEVGQGTMFTIRLPMVRP